MRRFLQNSTLNPQTNMEYEADRAENSRQMAARSIAFYRAMGRKIENNKLGGGVQQ